MPQIEPELPSGYAGMLVSLKELVASARVRAQEAASNAMVEMYWEIGSTILQRQAAQPWGTKILQRLAADLKSAFPHMRGFSRSNLFYMRAFAAVWDLSDPSVRNRVKGLPWGHIIELLKLKDPMIRDWVRRTGGRAQVAAGSPRTPDHDRPAPQTRGCSEQSRRASV